jgi:carotenoid 1,2-hydratase
MNHIELPSKSGAYRWYYVDVTSGEYTAVFIFMIGSIFSAKYSTSLKKGGLPREHAAVNFALYHRGVRTHWVLTEYGDVHLSPDGKRLTIGRSWLQYDEGRLTAEVQDKTTPFLMTDWGTPTKVSLELVPEGPTHGEVQLVPGLSHHWRPIAARAHAKVELDGLSLSGRGYHDGNYGDVPLGSDLKGWEWVRVHGPDATQITYRPWSGSPAHVVKVTQDAAELQPTPMKAPESVRTNWGLSVPRTLGVLLESSPFYARLESTCDETHALGEVADFQRFHSPSIRWMANFKTRNGSAA